MSNRQEVVLDTLRNMPKKGGISKSMEMLVEAQIEDNIKMEERMKKVEESLEQINERIRLNRAGEYARLIDPLHAEKTRKCVLEEWTPENESEYVSLIISLTQKIKAENPYKEAQ